MNQTWQPIETCPESYKEFHAEIWLAKNDRTYGPLYGVGWWCVTDGFGMWKSNLIKPTHWMPIIPLTED